MYRSLFHYPINEVAEYIHWSYFFHAWGMSAKFASVVRTHQCRACKAGWTASFGNEREQAKIAVHLMEDALRLLKEWEGKYNTHGVCRLCEANADGDDLILDGVRFPLLRQQMVKSEGTPTLCLSDFVRPLILGIPDRVGIFAATVDENMIRLYTDDPYRGLLVKILASRLAEATAERMHEEVRKVFWGYASDEQLTIPELHRGDFQGIRPAVGYPSLPDQSVNFIIDDMLNMEEVGVKLTENGAMRPYASVSGLMIAHPKARYFDVGRISREQLIDYARRRGLPVKVMEKYLTPLL